jgi:hypothetical protein
VATWHRRAQLAAGEGRPTAPATGNGGHMGGRWADGGHAGEPIAVEA